MVYCGTHETKTYGSKICNSSIRIVVVGTSADVLAFGGWHNEEDKEVESKFAGQLQLVYFYLEASTSWYSVVTLGYRFKPLIHNAPTEYDQIYRLLTGYTGGCQGVLPYISNTGIKIGSLPNNDTLP